MPRPRSRYIYNATMPRTSLVSIPLVRPYPKNYLYLDETLPIIRSLTFTNFFHQIVTANIHSIISAVIDHIRPGRSSMTQGRTNSSKWSKKPCPSYTAIWRSAPHSCPCLLGLVKSLTIAPILVLLIWSRKLNGGESSVFVCFLVYALY